MPSPHGSRQRFRSFGLLPVTLAKPGAHFQVNVAEYCLLRLGGNIRGEPWAFVVRQIASRISMRDVRGFASP
jgi:hypothetical protein